MKFAAFDLGQHMAVAHDGYGPADARATHLDLAPKGTRPERLAQAEPWLEQVLAGAEALGVDTVVYERPFARGEAATRALWGYAALIEAAAFRHGMAILDFPPSTVKKHATGSSKASKDDMLLAAFTTGYQWANEHEADAWCLLRYAEQNLSIENETPKCQTPKRSPTTKSSSGSAPANASAETVQPPAAPSGSGSIKERPAPVSRGVVASRRTRPSRSRPTS